MLAFLCCCACLLVELLCFIAGFGTRCKWDCIVVPRNKSVAALADFLFFQAIAYYFWLTIR